MSEVKEDTPKKSGKWKSLPRKKRRRIVRWTVILIVLAAIAAGAFWYFRGREDGQVQSETITDVVQYGSITSTVEGSGLTKAKSSESITISTVGTVQEVLVTEGQDVTAGTPLFTIDSPQAENDVESARDKVEGLEKQISTEQKNLAERNLTAPYAGKVKLAEGSKDYQPGDDISAGVSVATLYDDTRLRLEQYYSYAYEGQLYQGQTVDVSIPTLMSTLPGTVEAIHMVSRITPEGSKLFSAEISVKNDGALTENMAASATVNVDGETVYPYEPGTLAYYRSTELITKVTGTVVSNKLIDYLDVAAGQVLMQIESDDSESKIFDYQRDLETAREDLQKAEKNLANCKAKAPIDGKVIGLSIQPGDEVNSQTPIVTISDVSNIVVTATVDERNISYIQPGMTVDLDQWGTPTTGTVESVSLSSTVNNGVATYPMTIAVDNTEGTIQVNSNINYSLVASQNDNCLILPIQCVRTAATEEGEAVNVVYISGERPENAMEGVMVDEEIPEGFWPVPVEIGISDNYNVEIKSGVEEGTEVFTQIQTTEAWG